METSPCEAIKNNVMGTYKTAHAALKNGCQRFRIDQYRQSCESTNIMGAQSRKASLQMVIQTWIRSARTGRKICFHYLKPL